MVISLRRYMQVFRYLRPSEIFKQDSMSPSKIALQIVLLQIFYYTTATILFYGWGTMLGYTLEVQKWLFSWEPIEFTNSVGISLSILWLLDSLICVVFLTVIVERSKLAWDFAITIHAINLVVVVAYTGLIPSVSWFILQLLSSLILAFLGTWTTRWKELRDTFFEGLVDATTATHPVASHGNDSIELRDLENQR